MRYVAGLMFSSDRTRLALILKSKPAWQEGLFNAIGGKVEEGETSTQAMVREFYEETGVETNEQEWDHVLDLSGNFGEVSFLRSFSDKVTSVRTMEEELVQLVNPLRLPMNIVGNLRWIVPLSLDPTIAGPISVSMC